MDRLLPEYDRRVFFAAERTILALIRTGLALTLLGFVLEAHAVIGQFLSNVDLPIPVARRCKNPRELHS
jgi:uncharacterized membrane protein YidH (DUF202 family)